MTSNQKAKIAFTLALLLLSVSGIAAGIAIFRLYTSETQVRHTYDVEVAIGDLESSLTEVGRTRVAYVNSATAESLNGFENAVSKVSTELARIRQLISDNPLQRALWIRLESNVNQRVDFSRKSVDLKRQNRSDPQELLQATLDIARSAFETGSITQQMKRNEEALLEKRSHLSELLFTAIPGILLVSFLLSATLFWFHYRLLNRELGQRRNAENQLRQLSLELMRVQDEEHRRFARELHDGLGQTLAGTKMMVDSLLGTGSRDPQVAELAALLDEALTQTRTISYLFHPPFLDDIGFASAARWLVEGFAQRTGVSISANIPRPEIRLPRSLELTLYRVLQEALNNIHRHSKSSNAEVSFKTDATSVTLRIKDHGQGIPSEALAAFHTNGTHAGVGLMSMKERVREQSGELAIQSHSTGTEIVVKLPLDVHTESANSKSAESVL